MCVCTVCVFTRLADAGLCAVLWAAGKAAVSVLVCGCESFYVCVCVFSRLADAGLRTVLQAAG